MFKRALYDWNALETGLGGWENVLKKARYEIETNVNIACFNHIFEVSYSVYSGNKAFQLPYFNLYLT